MIKVIKNIKIGENCLNLQLLVKLFDCKLFMMSLGLIERAELL